MTADDDWGGINRHRAPRPDARTVLAQLGARLGVGALVLAALAIGGTISSHKPDADRRERPFLRTGAVGTPVSGRTFEITVLGMRGAGKLVRSGGAHDTGGVWILVNVRAEATAEPVEIGYAAVVDAAGRQYTATTRLTQPLVGGRTLQPGIPVEGEVAFEVPRPAATELTVRFADATYDQRMDAVAEVRLPRTDRATVDRWAGQSDPVVVANASAAP